MIWAVGILCKLSGRYPYYIVRITILQVFSCIFHKNFGAFFGVMSRDSAHIYQEGCVSPPRSGAGRPLASALHPAAAAPWKAASGTSPAFRKRPASASPDGISPPAASPVPPAARGAPAPPAGTPARRPALRAGVVHLVHVIAGAQQPMGQLPVVGQQQQPLRVLIQPPYWR